MGKRFDIIMTGVISGIVAITTTFLGLAGTIIGTVLGSIIYQSLSTYVKESLDQSDDKNKKIRTVNLQIFEDKIVFIIPIILIIIIEISFLSSIIYSSSTFNHLENLTNNNLFRAISIGLFALGLYSMFQPKKIRYQYGIVLLILSIFFLIRGSSDTSTPYIQELIYPFTDFLLAHDLQIAILIIIVLGYVTIKLFYDSMKLYLNENSKNNDLKEDNLNNRSTSKITSFHKGISKYDGNHSRSYENKKGFNEEKISHKTIGSYSKKDRSDNISEDEKVLIKSIGRRF